MAPIMAPFTDLLNLKLWGLLQTYSNYNASIKIIFATYRMHQLCLKQFIYNFRCYWSNLVLWNYNTISLKRNELLSDEQWWYISCRNGGNLFFFCKFPVRDDFFVTNIALDVIWNRSIWTVHLRRFYVLVYNSEPIFSSSESIRC